MKLLAIALLALGGCSLFDDGHDAVVVVDAAPVPDARVVIQCLSCCNPLSPTGQQGCATGQRCTWVSDQETPESSGHLGCVPDGTQAFGAACTRGPLGETTGFDDCLAGGICVDGTCHDICGFDNSANAACPAAYTCARVDGLFADAGDDPVAGACAPSCDPLTGDGCPSGQGCYAVVDASTTTAVCATAGTLAVGAPIVGAPMANSCVPGAAPRRVTADAASGWECGALCKPADVTSTTHVIDEGGVAPSTCEAAGAAPPGDATAGESCRHWWAREPFDRSPYSDALGFCLKHATWTYDSDGDGTLDAPFPRCIDVTHGDLLPPLDQIPLDDAIYFWCTTRSPAAQKSSAAAAIGNADRLGR